MYRLLFVLAATVLVVSGCGFWKSYRAKAGADPATKAYEQAYQVAKDNRGDVDRAAQSYDDFVAHYPDSPLVAQAMYNKGLLFHNAAEAMMSKEGPKGSADSVQKAVAAYDQFLARFPNDAQAPNALMKKGSLYQDAGDGSKAVDTYNTFLSKFPHDAQAGRVRTQRDGLRARAGTMPR